MNRILVPTDFSDISRYALDLAQKVAHNTQAEIHLLKVVNAPGDAVFDKQHELVEGMSYDLGEYESKRRKQQEKLEAWGHEATYVTETVTRVGYLIEEIDRYVADSGIDLVVMATHGAHGIHEMISGSHTERVVRTSPVPVLTLKCDRFDLDIKKIMLAGDFHHPDIQHLEMIRELQGAFGAELHLVKINTRRDFETQRVAMGHLRDFAGKNELENVFFHLYSDEEVEKGILNFADDFQMDLIAMGTHQRKGISHWINGSISEDVVNHLMKPVLTYKI